MVVDDDAGVAVEVKPPVQLRHLSGVRDLVGTDGNGSNAATRQQWNDRAGHVRDVTQTHDLRSTPEPLVQARCDVQSREKEALVHGLRLDVHRSRVPHNISGLNGPRHVCHFPPSPPCFAAQLPLTPEASELFGQNCWTAGQKTPVFQSKLPKIRDNSRQFGSF